MYSAFINASPDILFQIDDQGRFVAVSDAVSRLLDYRPEELIGKHIETIFSSDDVKKYGRENVIPQLLGKTTGLKSAPKLIDERRKPERATRNLTVKLIPKGWPTAGKEMLTAELSSSGYWKNNTFLCTVGMLRDITERNKLVSELQQSEATSRAFINAPIHDSIVMLDKNGCLLGTNQAIPLKLGKPAEELRGQCVYDFLPEGVARTRRRQIEKVFSSGTPERFEDSTGNKHFLNVISPVRDQHGCVQSVAVFSSDITDTIIQAQKISLLENMLLYLLKATKSGLTLVDEKATIRYIDPLRETRHLHLIGQKCYRLFKSEEHADTDCGARKAIETARQGQYDNLIEIASNTPVRVTTFPINTDSHTRQACLVSTDMRATQHLEARVHCLETDLKHCRRQAQNSNVLSADSEARQNAADAATVIGCISQGIAQDCTGILATIIGYSEMLESAPDLPAFAGKSLQQLITNARSGAALLQEQIAAAALYQPVFESVLLHAFFDKFQHRLSACCGEQHKVLVAATAAETVMHTCPALLRTALVLICEYAVSAMGGIGAEQLLNIEASVDAGAGDFSPEPRQPVSQTLRISIANSGCGISGPDNTKTIAAVNTECNKTATGLSIARRIIQQSLGGTLTSARGAGNSIEVIVAVPTSAQGAPAKGTQRSHILIADPDSAHGTLWNSLLAGLSPAHTFVDKSIDALELFKAHPELYDLVILDEALPHMTWQVLAEKIKAIRGHVRILVVTGNAALRHEHLPEKKGVSGFVCKPVTASDVRDAITRLKTV